MKWSAEHQLEVIYKSLGFSAPQYTIPPKEPSISEILCASLFLNLVSIYKLGSSEKLTNLITVRAVPALDIKSLKESLAGNKLNKIYDLWSVDISDLEKLVGKEFKVWRSID